MRLAAVLIATFSRSKVSTSGAGPRSGTLLNPAPLAGALAPRRSLAPPGSAASPPEITLRAPFCALGRWLPRPPPPPPLLGCPQQAA